MVMVDIVKEIPFCYNQQHITTWRTTLLSFSHWPTTVLSACADCGYLSTQVSSTMLNCPTYKTLSKHVLNCLCKSDLADLASLLYFYCQCRNHRKLWARLGMSHSLPSMAWWWWWTIHNQPWWMCGVLWWLENDCGVYRWCWTGGHQS